VVYLYLIRTNERDDRIKTISKINQSNLTDIYDGSKIDTIGIMTIYYLKNDMI
jgi:hypothetical protein